MKIKFAILSAITIVLYIILFFDIYLDYQNFTFFYAFLVIISSFYDSKVMLIGITGLCSILIILGWLFSMHPISIEALVRVSSLFYILTISYLSSNNSDITDEFNSYKNSVEMRILARTVASESRARKLEEQIKILQDIKEDRISNAMSSLDNVINTLKQLKTENEGDV